MIGSATSIEPNELHNRQEKRQVVYPSLNVYFSPRVYKDRIDHKNLPLCAYNRKIESTNVANLYDQPTPTRSELREFNLADGLIYQFGAMGNYSTSNPDIVTEKLKLKVLICVCMYNEGQTAINLTLNGIYENLPDLENEGIAADEIGVVLMQDGILKLVENKLTRTYAKGEDSMVHFFRTLDELEGKKRCDLEERINIILDESENLSRKGMDRNITDNRDFPVSIEKNISLLYQNLWRPSMTDHEGTTKDSQHYLKLFSCFKHTNGTKLSSHLWFFEGFCRYLNPEYVILLDVGTKPEKGAIANLLKGFTDEDVGGVTGFMTVDSNMKSQ
jgi:chitin synthase